MDVVRHRTENLVTEKNDKFKGHISRQRIKDGWIL